jgi:hypothetical protein
MKNPVTKAIVKGLFKKTAFMLTYHIIMQHVMQRYPDKYEDVMEILDDIKSVLNIR